MELKQLVNDGEYVGPDIERLLRKRHRPDHHRPDRYLLTARRVSG
jgi:hypothetical protein